MTEKDPKHNPPVAKRERPLIMVADDDPEIRKLLRIFLDDLDCDLIVVTDGAEALESVLVHRPDLVLLDVMMPELNGWQVCKYIKSKEELASTGIIMITAIGPVNNELTSPLFGADDYLDKPFDFDELEDKIKRVLALSYSSSSSEE